MPLAHPRHAARLAAGLLLALVSGCSGPCVLLPGGALDGETAPPPLNWSMVGDYGTAQLETNPADPYSVNLAYTVLDDTLYINAGDTETQWVQHMNADPSVRLRIDGVIYALRAERISDADEIGRFGKAWTDQSMFRRDPTELAEVWIYRLVPR